MSVIQFVRSTTCFLVKMSREWFESEAGAPTTHRVAPWFMESPALNGSSGCRARRKAKGMLFMDGWTVMKRLAGCD
jgi:hypothetical protein